jgi:peptidyl-prolyl cis-trans isomerase C
MPAMILGTSLLALLLASSPPGSGILALYRGGTVTRADYESWLLAQGQQDEEAQRRVRLESIALSESLEAAAVAAGLDREPQTAFRVAQIETGLLASALRRSVDRDIVVTDAEVEAELKAEEKERFRPRTIRLLNIFKRVPAGVSAAERAAVRERMEQLRKELLAGASFEDLAWRESDSQTRFRGGAMGYVRPGLLHPDVDRIAFALQKGELSAVIASADGFTLLRCDDIAEGREIPVDEARVTIRNGLWSRASLARQAGLRTELLREAAPRFADVAAAGTPAAEFRGGRVTEEELRWLGAAADASAESRRELLEEQVVRVAAAARARGLGLDKDPALVAQARWQRARLLATREMSRRINQTLIRPTEPEMRAYFEQNRERFQGPKKVDVSLIQWTLDRTQIPKQYADAEAVVARLAGGLAFEQAAREVSTHPSAAAGGRLGLQPLIDLRGLGPNVYRTIEELSPGQTSRLVQQDDKRLYVVKLWERQPPRPLTFAEAAAQVEQEMGDARVAALQKELEAQARSALGFELPPDASAAR